MRILVTAGNTLAPIDRVRCITNIFTGRTGAAIALEAYRRGHSLTLLTSHPEAVEETPPGRRWNVQRFRTFEDLHHALEDRIRSGRFQGVIQCAAISDYRCVG